MRAPFRSILEWRGACSGTNGPPRRARGRSRGMPASPRTSPRPRPRSARRAVERGPRCQRDATQTTFEVVSSQRTRSKPASATSRSSSSRSAKTKYPIEARSASSSLESRPVTTIGSVNMILPPGLRTRCQSRSTPSRSGRWLIASMQTTASNDASANGSGSAASACTKRASEARPSRRAALLAVSIACALTSTPTTRAPRVRARWRSGPPEPQATSSTCAPGIGTSQSSAASHSSFVSQLF